MKGKFEPGQVVSEPLATKESNALASGQDLDAQAKEAEHGRHQRFQEHANCAAIVLLWVVVALTLVGMLVFVLHLFLPESWRWVSSSNLEKIQTLLGAALLSSAMTSYVNKRMH